MRNPPTRDNEICIKHFNGILRREEAIENLGVYGRIVLNGFGEMHIFGG
jgi:hypothetical protein